MSVILNERVPRVVARNLFFEELMGRKFKLADVFAAIRIGCSLYGACVQAKMTTQEFYQLMGKDPDLREDFQLALSDYADQCTDDIRTLALNLKAGEIDTSTAKLLIETNKWLAQKACPDPFVGFNDDEQAENKTTEITVKFI